MKKYLAVIIVLCFGAFFSNSCGKGAPDAGTPELVPTSFSELSFAEVLAQAQQEKKHVLIDFFSPT